MSRPRSFPVLLLAAAITACAADDSLPAPEPASGAEGGRSEPVAPDGAVPPAVIEAGRGIADADADAWTPSAPSCTGAAGTRSCGAGANDDCCVAPAVPGGSFLRNDLVTHPATVSGFRLDKYEVTVGRVRAFFAAFGGNLRGSPPLPGAGSHPKIAGSGWRSSWNVRLPASSTEIDDRLGAAGCVRGGNNADGGTATWTSAPGPHEDQPITCIDWYTLFAFCAWDGARLPTDAELGYAEQGGDEQREFAWGGGPLAFATHRDHVVTGLVDLGDGLTKQTWGPLFRTQDVAGEHIIGGPEVIAPPGRKPLGNGRWGHADLTGNVLEWTLDEAEILAGACNDCARIDWPDPPQDQPGAYPPQWPVLLDNGDLDLSGDGLRSVRGGSWDPVHALSSWSYYPYAVFKTYGSIGGRCARD